MSLTILRICFIQQLLLICHDFCRAAPQPVHVPLPTLSVPLSSFRINITADDVSAYKATVTWPPLTDVQRLYISQLRLRYKELSYGVMEWEKSVDFR